MNNFIFMLVRRNNNNNDDNNVNEKYLQLPFSSHIILAKIKINSLKKLGLFSILNRIN